MSDLLNAAPELQRTPVVSATTLVQVARRVAEQIRGGARARDAERELPHEAMRLVREAGLGAARVPLAYGGPGASYRDVVEVFIALGRGDSNIAQALIPHFTSVERIRLMGSESQRHRFFADVVAGHLIAGGTSERGGKFRTDMSTRLSNDGDGYRLDGVKFYSTGSLFADRLRVTAINDRGERVSVIIPRDREGVVLKDDWSGMGQRTTASGTSEYHHVRVESDEVIPFGPWEATQRNYGSSGAQLLHATIEVGIAFAALDDAVQWARSGARPVRESGVERAVDDPYVQHTIGQIAAHARSAEATILRAAEQVDAAALAWHADPAHTGESRIQDLCITASVAVAEARIITHEAGLRAGELLFEVAGASATLQENGFDRHWRNARTHTTHDPIAYKFKAVGNYLLNGVAPPLSLYY